MSLKSPPPPKSPLPKLPPPDPDPPPNKSPSSSSFLWSSLFAESASTNAPSSSPTYLLDGTPVVTAPPSVILRASSTWAGHLLCRFLGEPPSPAKFFSDLNRIWGKHGDISVRRFSSGIFLVYVPSVSTRKWILHTGLWSSGTVSFVVSEWSVNSTLASPPKLTSATTLLTIREIPPQLWSHEAVARIAGGVAKLIPGTKASLPLSSLGTATIRVIVPLGSPLPPSVMVKDTQGDSVLVSIDYGRLPHLCSICSSYGHQPHRCPFRQSATKPISPKSNTNPLNNAEPVPMTELNSISTTLKGPIATEQSTSSLQPPLIQSPLHAPDTSSHHMELVHNMESDNKGGEGMDLESTSDNHQVPASSLSQSDPRQSPAQAPEVIIQNMDLDLEDGEGLILKRNTKLSDSNSPDSSSLTAPSVAVTEMEIEGSSFAVPKVLQEQVELSSAQPLIQDSSHSTLPVAVSEVQSNSDPPTPVIHSHQEDSPNPQDQTKSMAFLVEPVALNTTVPSHSESPVFQSLSHPEEKLNQTSSVDDPAEFTYPPPPSCAAPQLSNDCSQVLAQLVTDSGDERVKKRTKRNFKLDTKAVLRCSKVSHQFKPIGVVEKRQKKINTDQIPTDEDFQNTVLEMKSDKAETLYFEAIDAQKIIRKLESGHQEEDKT